MNILLILSTRSFLLAPISIRIEDTAPIVHLKGATNTKDNVFQRVLTWYLEGLLLLNSRAWFLLRRNLLYFGITCVSNGASKRVNLPRQDDDPHANPL